MLSIQRTGFQYLTVQLGFWIPIVRAIPDSKTQDSEFHKQNFPDSGFHKQKFPRFQNPDSLSTGKLKWNLCADAATSKETLSC